MRKLLAPTRSAADWQRLLAKPDLHWKAGASAMAAASSWESANDLPNEVRAALATGPGTLQDLELLIAIPEWEVPLPGGSTTSHTDVLALARNSQGLVVIAVEAKVEEAFGPTLGEKRAEASSGQAERLRFLHGTLGLADQLPDTLRYQLLHRTASAQLTTRMFHAATAVMLVQSFSPSSRWFDDFTMFAAALGTSASIGRVAAVLSATPPQLYLGWCAGDQRHLQASL